MPRSIFALFLDRYNYIWYNDMINKIIQRGDDRVARNGFDSYWDSLELLYIKDKKVPPTRPNVDTDTVEITDAGRAPSSSTLIERKITTAPKKTEDYETVDEYIPENSLIRRVKISKRKGAEVFYEDFCAQAREMQQRHGESCDYVPLNMYSPTYSSLNKQQMRYYLWWRENLRQGIALKTDSGYILLLCEEIINLGADGDTRDGMKTLVFVWRSYYGKLSPMPFRLIDWICDYGMIHHLPPPEDAEDLITTALSLKEYFLYAPVDAPDVFTESLLKFCSSYDYTKSKFAATDVRALYDKHVRGALCDAVKYFSSDNALLTGLEYTNSKIERDSYVGILCSTKEKYRIECEYCSISCSGELRFLVGDIVKYAENKIRAHIGVKSKLSVYLISMELGAVLQKYFDSAMTEPVKQQKKKEEKQPYDILYDQPKKQLSLTDAKRIEKESWKTTESLVDAFGENEAVDVSPQMTPVVCEIAPPVSEQMQESENDSDLRKTLGGLCGFVDAVKDGDATLQREIAVNTGKLPDALVDEINEIAVDVFGDILIEDRDGILCIIEDYLELLE